jgi:hypothetical protein
MWALILALAGARPLTYCVGGYDGTPPNVQAACARPDVVRQHGDWHEHFWITDGQTCAICYDEVDNSCYDDFVANNPRWTPAISFQCILRRPYVDGVTVMEHKIGGETVSSTPPSESPRQLVPVAEVVSPGPYVAGDRVTLSGRVDDGGAGRPVAGGTFEVYVGDDLVDRVSARAGDDGRVRADVALPAGERVRVRFVPEAPQMNPGDTLKGASDDLALNVDACAFRARLATPAPGDALASGQTVSLEAVLLDSQRRPVTPGGASLRFTVVVGADPPVVIDADAAGAARWTPPPVDDAVSVDLFATGTVGDQLVCHDGPTRVQLSDVGLGLDASGLPATCYVGLDCAGVATLKRPPPGAARQRVDALLADPATVVRWTSNGEVRGTFPARPDDRYTLSMSFDHPVEADWRLEVVGPDGVVTLPSHDVSVRPKLSLRLPQNLDFGSIRAGTRVADTCVDLDLSASEAAWEHRFQVALVGAETCRGRPVMATTTSTGRLRTHDLSAPITVEAFDPANPVWTFCLDAPRCGGEVSPDGVQLRITPLTPIFADQAATVGLRWEVERRGLLSCHLWWMAPSAFAAFFLWFIYGWIRPARFPANASIRVAGRQKDLKKAPAVLLRDCPGSGAGFYRDARLGLQADGDVNGRVRTAMIRLRARKDVGMVLEGGALEVMARGGKWEPVEDLRPGHVPGTGEYRIGENLYFKVDPG